VRELTEMAGVPARTLDRLLNDLELGDELPTGCVLILDEAGMAATRPSARALEAAEQAGAKVIAIGDPGQLASVQAGGWLGAVGRELGALRPTEVMRQRDPAERRALATLHEHLPQHYLDWAGRAGRIDTFSDLRGACDRALDEWARASAEVGPSQAVMIARDNDTRQVLNSAARELWRALGLLGEESTYGSVDVGVGDRVICRRNDRLIDVDNGMRGTVRHVDSDRVVIDTDSGLVRELPAAYVSEHLEHAYSLTGHGMQGGTVETAVVVASPRDLTAGWSYTALSRARGETRLLIHNHTLTEGRSEFAPSEQSLTAARGDLLARVRRHMLERDDQDLAIEQLAGAGRADDPELTGSRELASEPPQERGAALAEPARPAAPTRAQLRELGERVEELHAQLRALPLRKLEHIEHYDERTLTLLAQRERHAARLAALPEPHRRFGRERDPHADERHRLRSTVESFDDELDHVRTLRSEVARELVDVPEVRAERDGLAEALSQSVRERTAVRDELIERELHASGAWVRDTFGERPDGLRAGEVWEHGVRLAARYRVEHDITGPGDALGPQPEQHDEQREWERARKAIARDQRQLGRDAPAMTDQQLLTVEQVAREFQLTSQTIRNWIKSGALSAVKIGHVYRVRSEDVDAMMSRHQGETAPLGTHRDIWAPETLGMPYRRHEDRRQPSIWDGTSSSIEPSKRS
jgi:excisionase family DNA binding protein